MVNALATLALVAITAYYVSLTNELVRQTQTDQVLSHEPVVRIEPPDAIRKNDADGQFDLHITNTGINGIKAVEVFYDAYVAVLRGSELTLWKPGLVIDSPRVQISAVEPNESVAFEIDISSDLPKVYEFYDSRPKGTLMTVLHLLVRYERSVDGTGYSLGKVYVVGGGGYALLDVDDDVFESGIPRQLLKAAFGASS